MNTGWKGWEVGGTSGVFIFARTLQLLVSSFGKDGGNYRLGQMIRYLF